MKIWNLDNSHKREYRYKPDHIVGPLSTSQISPNLHWIFFSPKDTYNIWPIHGGSKLEQMDTADQSQAPQQQP